jgi:hypothetical protein
MQWSTSVPMNNHITAPRWIWGDVVLLSCCERSHALLRHSTRCRVRNNVQFATETISGGMHGFKDMIWCHNQNTSDARCTATMLLYVSINSASMIRKSTIGFGKVIKRIIDPRDSAYSSNNGYFKGALWFIWSKHCDWRAHADGWRLSGKWTHLASWQVLAKELKRTTHETKASAPDKHASLTVPLKMWLQWSHGVVPLLITHGLRFILTPISCFCCCWNSVHGTSCSLRDSLYAIQGYSILISYFMGFQKSLTYNFI